MKTLPEPRNIDVAGVDTRYYEAGSGDPVVFVYGGNFGSSDSASSAYTWSLNWRDLSARHRVIIPDKLGQGHTGNPTTDGDYTMGAVVSHLARFLASMNLPPVHLVGHSRGGYAAARLTLEHHDLVRSVTLVNSGTLSPGVGTNEVFLSRPPYPKFTAECVRWVYENYSFDPSVVTDEWVGRLGQCDRRAALRRPSPRSRRGDAPAHREARTGARLQPAQRRKGVPVRQLLRLRIDARSCRGSRPERFTS